MTGEQEEQPSTSTSQKPGTSTNGTESKSQGDELEKAASALVHGKRNLLIKDLQLSMISLGEACRIYAEKLGPFAAESAESHYFYGKALLENARSELTVLPQEPIAEESEDEEEDGDENENDDKNGAAEENRNGTKEEDVEENRDATQEEGNEENGDATKEEDSEENGDATEEEANEENGDATKEKDSEENGEVTNAVVTAEGGEEPSSLELAWEALEIAKVAFEKQLEGVEEEKESDKSDEELEKIRTQRIALKRRLADTYLLLGDVATESELYSQAVEDYITALDIIKATERDDSREIAQCYFQLGLAYSFDKKFTESIECFQKSVDLINDRIKNLQLMIDTNQTAEERGIVQPESSTYSEVMEIAELKNLLPEMEEKVTDTVDAQKESLKTKEEEKVEKEILLRNSPVKNPNAPAPNDISHLVKKKKKLDLTEEEIKLQPPAKKPCMDP